MGGAVEKLVDLICRRRLRCGEAGEVELREQYPERTCGEELGKKELRG